MQLRLIGRKGYKMSAIFKMYEDGSMRLVSTNENKYLVTFEIEGELSDTAIMTPRQIFDKMDLDDCYDISVENIYLIKKSGAPVKVQFRGCRHRLDDPLRMSIFSMSGKTEYDYGYGTDH